MRMPADDAAKRRDIQAEVREKQAGVREDQAGVREAQSGVREDQSELRDTQAGEREVKVDKLQKITNEHQSTLSRYVRLILWATVLLLIASSVNVLRSYQIERNVETLDDHTRELGSETEAAKNAAVEARDVLQAAIDQGRENAAAPGAVKEALLAISRIEAHLCGGPCDAPNIPNS